jgi:hypothetical protein
MGPMYTRELFTESETAFYCYLKSHRANRDRAILAFTKLSTFLSPEGFKKVEAEADACYCCPVTFAVLSMRQNGRVVLAVLDQSSPHASTGARLLRECEVTHVLQGSFPGDKDRLMHETELALNAPAGVSRLTQKAINDPESEVRVKLQSALGLWFPSPHKFPDISEYMKHQREKFAVFHEVALDAVLTPGSERDPAPSVLKTGRFDLLVATPPPFSEPLLVVEHDGPTHDDPKRKRKDAERDELCASANLPVLRIRLPKKEHSGFNHEDLQTASRLNLLGHLAESIGERKLLAHSMSKRHWEYVHEFAGRRLKDLREREMKRLSVSYLDTDTLARLEKEALYAGMVRWHDDWETTEHGLDESIEFWQEEERGSWQAWELGNRINEKGGRVEVTLDDTPEGKAAHAAVTSAEGNNHQFTSPRFQFQVSGMPQETVDALIRNFAIEWALEAALQHLSRGADE